MKYVQCAKVDKLGEQFIHSQIAFQFMLDEHYVEDQNHMPIRKNARELACEMLGIDLKVYDKELEHMLQAQREANNEVPSIDD